MKPWSILLVALAACSSEATGLRGGETGDGDGGDSAGADGESDGGDSTAAASDGDVVGDAASDIDTLGGPIPPTRRARVVTIAPGEPLPELAEDTEVVFLDGVHGGYAHPVFSSYGARPELPPHITFRAATYRGATLEGPGDPTGPDGGNAFDLADSGRDIEIWGLVFVDWMDTWGNGVITLHGDIDGVRIIGNRFAGNGSGSTLDHSIYLSGGDSYATAPRNLVIAYNETSEPGGNGAFIHAYVGAGSQFAPHDWRVEHNVVRGTQAWGLIIDPNFGNPANILIADNDIRLSASAAVLDFWYGDPQGKNGVDASCIVRDNILVQTGNGAVVLLQEVDTGAAHAPVLSGNRYWNTTGGAVLSGIGLGVGDVIAAP